MVLTIKNAIAMLALTVMLAGCATGQPRGWVDASAWSANYTEDYIPEFHLETPSGKNLLLSGIQVKEFTKGGTGGRECCSPIPGVGQTIRVVWQVGGRQEPESQWRTMPKSTEEHSVVLVRFFQDHEIEAELLPGDGDFGPTNPRIDKLFFAGPRIMRRKGE